MKMKRILYVALVCSMALCSCSKEDDTIGDGTPQGEQPGGEDNELPPGMREDVFTVTLPQAGALPSLISPEDKYRITELKVVGDINGTDFRLLRDMAGRDENGAPTQGVLGYLDLSEANVVAGGTPYYKDEITDNNGLGSHAFFQCGALTTIFLPDGLSFEGGSFDYGMEGEPTDGVFAGCTGLLTVSLGKGLRQMPACSFWGCSNLSSISLPDTVEEIGARAFMGCSTLKDIMIPEGVISIGIEAFKNCYSLSSVSLPQSLRVILVGAFDGCALETLTIPEGVVQINNAFSFVTSLKSLYFLSQNPPVGTFNIGEETIVYVPKGRVEAYKSQFMWSDFTDRICEME